RAIELNGAAVKLNKRAFLWGRILSARPELARDVLGHGDVVTLDLPALNEAYAARYRSVIAEVQARETAVAGAPGRLTRAAAEGLFRLMAYKDEYEVA